MPIPITANMEQVANTIPSTKWAIIQKAAGLADKLASLTPEQLVEVTEKLTEIVEAQEKIDEIKNLKFEMEFISTAQAPYVREENSVIYIGLPIGEKGDKGEDAPKIELKLYYEEPTGNLYYRNVLSRQSEGEGEDNVQIVQNLPYVTYKDIPHFASVNMPFLKDYYDNPDLQETFIEGRFFEVVSQVNAIVDKNLILFNLEYPVVAYNSNGNPCFLAFNPYTWQYEPLVLPIEFRYIFEDLSNGASTLTLGDLVFEFSSSALLIRQGYLNLVATYTKPIYDENGDIVDTEQGMRIWVNPFGETLESITYYDYDMDIMDGFQFSSYETLEATFTGNPASQWAYMLSNQDETGNPKEIEVLGRLLKPNGQVVDITFETFPQFKWFADKANDDRDFVGDIDRVLIVESQADNASYPNYYTDDESLTFREAYEFESEESTHYITPTLRTMEYRGLDIYKNGSWTPVLMSYEQFGEVFGYKNRFNASSIIRR